VPGKDYHCICTLSAHTPSFMVGGGGSPNGNRAAAHKPKVHMGSNQEAYDAECAALACALEIAAQRNTTPERVTIFSDAQAAIRRMASDEPGAGQKYAIQARRRIAALRRVRHLRTAFPDRHLRSPITRTLALARGR